MRTGARTIEGVRIVQVAKGTPRKYCGVPILGGSQSCNRWANYEVGVQGQPRFCETHAAARARKGPASG